MAVAGRYNMMILPEIGITFKNCKMEARCSLIEAYCARLRLDDPSVLQPTVETLRLLTERHFEYVPFENISMHLSQKEEPVVLERDKLIHKILVQGRGGCCLELNGLFHLFLKQLGYAVQLVPCWVNAGRERGHKSKKAKFRVQQSHFFLLVSASKKMWMVDVGLGEPPCHPLEYGLNQQTQQTPDGMKSRIVWDPRGPWMVRPAKRGRALCCSGGSKAPGNRGCSGMWSWIPSAHSNPFGTSLGFSRILKAVLPAD
jgi:arylamine N-acetyltransferase